MNNSMLFQSLMLNYVRLHFLRKFNVPDIIMTNEMNLFKGKMKELLKQTVDVKMQCRKSELENINKMSPCLICTNRSVSEEENFEEKCKLGESMSEHAIVERSETGCPWIAKDPEFNIEKEKNEIIEKWKEVDHLEFLRFLSESILAEINKGKKDG
jgi:hypothetical protein